MALLRLSPRQRLRYLNNRLPNIRVGDGAEGIDQVHGSRGAQRVEHASVAWHRVVSLAHQGRHGRVERLCEALAKLIVDHREKAFRMKVGKMLADGDCRGAARLALESGRLELGQSIIAACQPDSAPTTSGPEHE